MGVTKSTSKTPSTSKKGSSAVRHGKSQIKVAPSVCQEKEGNLIDPLGEKTYELARDQPRPSPSPVPQQGENHPDVQLDTDNSVDDSMPTHTGQDSAGSPSFSGRQGYSPPQPSPRPSPRPSPSSYPPPPHSSHGAEEDDATPGPVDTIIFDDAIVHTREKNAELLAQARAKPLRFPSPGTIARVEAAAEKVARRYDGKPAWIDLHAYITAFEHGAEFARKEVSERHHKKEIQRLTDAMKEQQAKTKRQDEQLAKIAEARKEYIAEVDRMISDMKREHEEEMERLATKAEKRCKRMERSLKYPQWMGVVEDRRRGSAITGWWPYVGTNDPDVDDQQGNQDVEQTECERFR